MRVPTAIERVVDVGRIRRHLPAFMAEPDAVLEQVAKELNLTREDILSERRFDKFVFARAVVAILLRDGGLSWPEIGAVLERDHSTIMYLVERYRYKIERDAELAAWVDALRPESIRIRPPAPEPGYYHDFDTWYAAYPRKRERSVAQRAYVAQRRKGATADQLAQARDNYVRSLHGVATEYVKYAATFLKCWVDYQEEITGPQPAPERTAPPDPRQPHEWARCTECGFHEIDCVCGVTLHGRSAT